MPQHSRSSKRNSSGLLIWGIHTFFLWWEVRWAGYRIIYRRRLVICLLCYYIQSWYNANIKFWYIKRKTPCSTPARCAAVASGSVGSNYDRSLPGCKSTQSTNSTRERCRREEGNYRDMLTNKHLGGWQKNDGDDGWRRRMKTEKKGAVGNSCSVLASLLV
jgi:hypothetical protein